MASAKHKQGRPRRRALRPLKDQVVVITGGSRGIGRATAIRFASAGATVVILARGEQALAATVDHIVGHGGTAKYIVCDVTDPEGVAAAVRQAEQWFGRVDTFVANAGALLYARVSETTAAELRQVLEINVVGQLNCIHAAIPALRRAGGGAFIGISSTEALVSLPFHGAYASSKHALEGLSDALRRELRREAPSISVTTVRPTVTDTPGYRHTRSRMHHRPTAPHPHYAASVVADAVLFAARHPTRTIHGGGGARFFTMAHTIAPSLMDSILSRFDRFMHTSEPAAPREGNLFSPLDDTDPRGALPGSGRKSLYIWWKTHPLARRVVTATAVGVAVRRLAARVE